MNMSLPSEVIWSLAITTLIGLWLVRQSVLIGYQIDILNTVVNWFNKKNIILLSFLFIITPFIAPHLIRQISEHSSGFITVPVDRALTIFATASSIVIGNRYLEGFKKGQEQKKVAKLIIPSIEGQIEKSKKNIIPYLKGSLRENEAQIINEEINQIYKDYIYESALKEIGVFELKEVEIIATYSRDFNSVLSNIIESYDKEKKYTKINLQYSSKKQAEALMIDAKLCIMTLSKKILRDNDKFNEYKEKVKEDYCSKKFYNEKEKIGQLSPTSISLNRAELLFKEFGLSAELEDTYNTYKIEFEKYLED